MTDIKRAEHDSLLRGQKYLLVLTVSLISILVWFVGIRPAASSVPEDRAASVVESGEFGQVPRGPCNQLMKLSGSDAATTDVLLFLLSQGLPEEVPVPNDMIAGSIYCWDSVPEVPGNGLESLHGVAVMDEPGLRVWFVNGPHPLDDVDWSQVLRDYGAPEVVTTEYGFASHPKPDGESSNLWDKVADKIAS